MAILSIVTGIDNSILRAQSMPIKRIDKKLKKLVSDMLDTVISCDGLGIAAPQVGYNLRLYIARLNFGTKNETWVTMINPEFLKVADPLEEREEGCLSIPGDFGVVQRARAITIGYADLKNKRHVLGLNGLNARIMQHEMDHLNGVLIADKMKRKIGNE